MIAGLSRRLSSRSERIPEYLFALCVVLGAVMLVEIANQVAALRPLATVSADALPWEYIVSFLISAPFILALGYGAKYLAAEPFPTERNPRIFKWCLGGISVWLVINLLTMVSFGYIEFWPTVGWIRGAAAWGGAFGLLIGIIEARAITRAVETEQAQLRAEHLTERQDTLDYVNSMLRHEVLNSTNVVQGHARLLEQEIPDAADHRRHVEPIVRRSADIESFVKSAREMMESLHQTTDLEPVDLEDVLLSEAAKLRDLNPDVVVTVDVPDGVTVTADALLGRLFGNLMSNAVEHNDSAPARISVSVTETAEQVVVFVSDNGPGIDDDTRAGLFDRPETVGRDHGFGLYIVDRLCERYGGTIGVTETGEEGTTFRVTLFRADTGSEQRPTEATVSSS